jgi:hypothetical protein
MQATPDPRHWWSLVLIDPRNSSLCGVFVTEADCVEIALARAELAGARPPGSHVSAAPFRANYVHSDFLDVLMTCAEFQAMPEPAGFHRAND